MNRRRWVMGSLIAVCFVCAAGSFLKFANLVAMISAVNGLDGLEDVTRSARIRAAEFFGVWILCEIIPIIIMITHMKMADDLSPALKLVSRGLVATTIAVLSSGGLVILLSAMHYG